MSAPPWWSGMDDAALQALGSAGLLRRARAAVVGEVTRTGDAVGVEVDGFRVVLGGKGPADARCPCPATGLCLHVLAAVLTLRGAAPAVVADVSEELGALSVAEIAAFAGSDLPQAVRLAAGTPPHEDTGAGPSVTLHPAGLSHPVTFLAGAGLRGAVWKGSDGRRRLAVTAALLILRAARGLPMPPVGAVAAAARTEPALLAAIAAQIEAALVPVLAGCGVLATDRLLDLALTARLDAAPRLALALRAVVDQAHRIDRRGPDADAQRFLIAAARAQALAHAMASPEGGPDLGGQLRRDYQPAPPLALVMLGARSWTGETGARGLRLWGFDRAGRRWISTGEARADGLDRGFSPAGAYRGPMLGRPSAAATMGQALTFDAPRLSGDGVLAGECLARAEPDPGQALPDETDWPDLTTRLRSELGPALTRDARLGAALLCPVAIRHAADGGKDGALLVLDRYGRTLTVTLDGLTANAVSALAALPGGSRLLVEACEDWGRLRLRLVSVVTVRTGLTVWCPSLDPVPGPGTRALPVRRPDAVSPRPVSPAESLARDLLRAAVDIGCGQAADPGLGPRAAASGIAFAVSFLTPPATPAKALRLAWIAAELGWRADM